MKILKDVMIAGKHDKSIMLDVFYKQDGVPKPVVIFAHGFKGFKDWGHFNLLAHEIAKEGFVFIKFNFSHNGTTPDRLTEFADLEAFGNNNYSIELDDLNSVIEWMMNAKEELPEEEADRDKIYLAGHSRGGGIVIIQAHEDERVKKVITLASINNFMGRWGIDFNTWKNKGVHYIQNFRTNQQMPLYYQIVEDYYNNKERLDIEKAVRELDKPMLIVHGDRDEAVPYEDALEMASWNDKAELFTVKGGSHTFGGYHPYNEEHLPVQLKLVVQEMVRFLRQD